MVYGQASASAGRAATTLSAAGESEAPPNIRNAPPQGRPETPVRGIHSGGPPWSYPGAPRRPKVLVVRRFGLEGRSEGPLGEKPSDLGWSGQVDTPNRRYAVRQAPDISFDLTNPGRHECHQAGPGSTTGAATGAGAAGQASPPLGTSCPAERRGLIAEQKIPSDYRCSGWAVYGWWDVAPPPATLDTG